MWFVRDLRDSLFRWDRYRDLRRNKMGRAIGTGLIFSLLVFIITLLPVAYAYKVELGGFDGIIGKIPDFRIQNSKLWVSENMEYIYGGDYIKVDTDTDLPNVGSTELQEMLKEHTNVLLIDADAVISKTSGNFQTLYFSDLPGDIEKADLYALRGIYHIIVGVILGLTLLFYIIGYFFINLIVSLLALPLSGIGKVSFSDVYKLAFYARNWGVALGLIDMLITIPYLSWIRLFLSIGILVYAIRKMNKESHQPGVHTMQGENIFEVADNAKESYQESPINLKNSEEAEEKPEQRKNYGDIKPSDAWSFSNHSDKKD